MGSMSPKEPAGGQYRKGKLDQSAVKCAVVGNVVTSRLNAGGDTAFRGSRGHKGATSKGKGMNKNAY